MSCNFFSNLCVVLLFVGVDMTWLKRKGIKCYYPLDCYLYWICILSLGNASSNKLRCSFYPTRVSLVYVWFHHQLFNAPFFFSWGNCLFASTNLNAFSISSSILDFKVMILWKKEFRFHLHALSESVGHLLILGHVSCMFFLLILFQEMHFFVELPRCAIGGWLYTCHRWFRELFIYLHSPNAFSISSTITDFLSGQYFVKERV